MIIRMENDTVVLWSALLPHSVKVVGSGLGLFCVDRMLSLYQYKNHKSGQILHIGPLSFV